MDRHDDTAGPEVRLARTSVPAAPRSFREQLRAQFVSGELAAVPMPDDAVELERAPAPKIVRTRRRSESSRRGAPRADSNRSRFRLVPLGLAAAAAVVFAVILPGDDSRTWITKHASEVAALRLDGQGVGVDAQDLPGLSRVLSRAELVSFREAELELSLPEGVHIAVLPTTVLKGSPFRTLAEGEPLIFDLAQGEIFVRTDPGTGPHDIRILTPQSEVLVTGTTLGVMCHDDQTCVCVADGDVVVLERGKVHGLKSGETVEGGETLFLQDGQSPAPFDVAGVKRQRKNSRQFDQHVANLESFHRR